ncbi:MAG: tetratricopeptide repeat protein, partial [Gammaproteobacteria bacterium]
MEELLIEAITHHQAFEFDTAETLYRRCLEQQPANPEVMNLLGTLLAQTDRAEQGEQMIRQVIDRDPGFAPAWNNLGSVLSSGGRSAEAEQAYRQAARLEPRFPEVHSNIGMELVKQGRVAEAAESLQQGAWLDHGPGNLAALLQGGPREIGRSRLAHDLEQLDYLSRHGLLEARYQPARETMRQVLAQAGDRETVALSSQQSQKIARVLNRFVHFYSAPACAGPAVNPALDISAIEQDYFASGPGIVYFDDFLTEEALLGLRRFCLESTFWFKEYPRGYLGAMMQDGFCCPLLLQIAEQLRLALPGVFKAHTLREWWAFKYDSRLDGIPLHADHAAVNVNFWITPDEALLDPTAGGLTVWDREAPLDWDFARYNQDEDAMREFLGREQATAVYVPYRQNRVVMFNSDLFHETGALRFRDGYQNRR